MNNPLVPPDEMTKHLLYFEVPPKVMEAMTKPYDNLAERIGVLAASCLDLEPEQLSDEQRIALAILGGCAWERTETGIRVTDAFGIQKVEGRWIVGIQRDRRRGDVVGRLRRGG
jgi:hypothetical protein